MGNPTRDRVGPIVAALLGVALALGGGCASPLRSPVAYHYFERPDPADPWNRKIEGWQKRERSDRADPHDGLLASVAGPGRAPRGDDPGDLLTKYESFRAKRKRDFAREIAHWIQEQARDHYRADGPVDQWATLAETFRSNGDDCDGLELLTNHLLRDFGFAKDEVYRAIVYRPSDGQHHMVTLWFEDRNDPWVIDPTGAMTSGMPRMSAVPDWTPLRVFSEDEIFSVGPRLADANN
jgi:hypothetical protein